MKRLVLVYAWLLLFALAGCKSDLTNEEKIAGKEEKTWEATREVNAEGQKDKITSAEKKQSITFWRNGNVRMSDGNEAIAGQWSLQGNNLSLVFAGSDVSENFTVLELEKNEMKLRAEDGSQLTMKPD